MFLTPCTVIIFIGLLWNGTQVLAGDVDSAKAALDQAHSDYFKAIMKLPLSATPDDLKRVQQEILGPAQKAYGKAQTDKTKEDFERAKEEGAQRDKAANHPKLMKVKRIHELGKDANPQISPSSPPLSGGKTVAPPAPSGPSRPEFVLDGHSIPKEIEFGGHSKKKGGSALSSKPAELPSLMSVALPSLKSSPLPSPKPSAR